MFALSNFFQSGSDKNTEVLKPWWNVINDYLVVLMMAVPIFVGGMELAFGELTCLPIVDCSFSKNGTLLSESIYRKTCSAFDSSRNSTDANREARTVITGFKHLPEYDYVSSECSKTCVHWFHSHFSLFVFGQAFILLVLNNLWLKFPSTASLVNTFCALVEECYNLPIPGARIVQNNQQDPRPTEEDPQNNLQEPRPAEEEPQNNQQGTLLFPTSNNQQPVIIAMEPMRVEEQESLLSASSNNQQPVFIAHEPTRAEDQERCTSASNDISSDSQHEISVSVDLQTAVIAKALFEKIRRFNGYIKASRKIQILYLAQAVLQVVFTVLFLWIDFVHRDDLKGTVDCPSLPFFHYNFTFSHNLASVFQMALWLFLILLASMLIFCVISVIWTTQKVNFCKRNREYCFKNMLKDWGKPSDLSPATEDMGFLLHLLHICNELYAVQFAICMSKKQYKKFKALILDSEWPMEKLEKCVSQYESGMRSLHLKGLGGIPNSLFQFSFTFYSDLTMLKIDRCGPLEADDLREFSEFCALVYLEVTNCGLTGKIPEEFFEFTKLQFLDLQNNSIMHIQDGISKLKTLMSLKISSNKLKTIDASIATLPLRFIDISNNPYIQISAIKNVLACQQLQILSTDIKQNDIESKLNGEEVETFKRVTDPSAQISWGEDQEHDHEDGEDL